MRDGATKAAASARRAAARERVVAGIGALVLMLTTLAPGACARKTGGGSTLNLVTTTTTQDSGLLDGLVPAAARALGLHIRVLAVGSGEALKLAERGEADVVMAHSPAAEEKSVAAGHLVDRVPLMWNQFLIVGPPQDPAKIAGLTDPGEAFRRIRAARATFVSRGDESGTHRKEQDIARAAGLDPHAWTASLVSTGQGQGETVLVASQRAAYALCDTSTWAKLHTTIRPSELAVLVASSAAPGDAGPPRPIPSLVNPYHVMRANEAVHPGVNVDGAKRFIAWVTGREAAPIITAAGFTLGTPPDR
jgi:tungstate transport system substrate-binding protein